MSAIKERNRLLAKRVIKNMQERFMEAYFCETKEDALQKALELIPEGSTVSWGGTMTMKEIKLLSALRQGNYNLLDRETAKEGQDVQREAFFSDYYIMSSNAISDDGQLINIDGNGNRVAALIYGPENVIIIAGMNKIVKNVEEGISRTRNTASPQNCLRLGKNNPCAMNGVCGNCLADTICDQIVITRASRVPNRIKVILVGEELGF